MINCFGIRFRFHPLFVVLMAFSVATGYFAELITLFGIVLIHELGHVSAARGFGWKIREIQLLPFGGVAVTDESGNAPAKEEMAVALAGPLQNALMIAFALFMKSLGLYSPDWWSYFIEANLMIGSFNLLPILPLDGGKVLQGLLSYLLPYHQALLIGALSSLFLSMGLLLAALYTSGNGHGIPINLLIIGVFLLYSNWYGYRNIPFAHVRFLMGRQARSSSQTARGALAQPIVVHRGQTVGEILRLFMKERYHLIYVLNDRGAIQRVVPEQRMIDAYFREKKPGSAVSDLFM